MPADPTQVDSGHYSVEMENDTVRVLRIKYGPHEKSAMHWHPHHLAVTLTPAHFRMHFPDGTSQDLTVGAGEIIDAPSGEHLPENLSDQPFEAIAIELKGHV